jgi:beta-galactosidase
METQLSAWLAIYGPDKKNVDIQKAAIVQNGESEATEKTGRTGLFLPSLEQGGTAIHLTT